MIKKLFNKLERKLTKKKILDRFITDGIEYRVIETTNILPSFKNRRGLIFRKDDMVYNHSAIYTNPKYHFQPVYKTTQKIISAWAGDNSLNNTLVLGCAGCTIPRFMVLSFPDSKITGIELSEDFIKIANKYFLLDEISKQFTLIQGDAIDYIENSDFKEKRDVIVVDIFDANTLISDIFSDGFTTALPNHTTENSIIIFNLFGKNIDEITAFTNTFSFDFDGKYILCSKDDKIPSRELILLRTINKNYTSVFEEKLKLTGMEIHKLT